VTEVTHIAKCSFNEANDLMGHIAGRLENSMGDFIDESFVSRVTYP
jgi:hypothetical protein